jgi:16S rRNA (cytosine967-C5)-methyltransferase
LKTVGQISAARKAAFQVLMALERDQARDHFRGHSHADDLLRGSAINALSAPDRHLATALVLGVLRWQIAIDRQLKPLLARPDAKLDAEIRIVLRLGAFQLLHMDRIPARAAIDQSVELAKWSGHRFGSGMVNAVLRKIVLTPRSSEANAAELAQAEAAYPPWMVERWITFFGWEAARAICRHGQSQPVLCVRLANPAVEAELITVGVVLETGSLLADVRLIISGDVTGTDAFRDGRVRLQDEGSQLVAELAAFRGENPKKEAKILDSCAAPGGKTLILAERNPEARIVACESSASRLEQLRQRLATLGERVECRLADASTLTEESAFDRALVDVPCSGTGTLGRNPEIRHRLHIEDLGRQAERQRAILLAVLGAVRPGGTVVYSTCSLEPEENEQVLTATLAEFPSDRVVSLAGRIDELLGSGILTPQGAERLHNSLTPEGYLRLLPGAFSTDGFFVALLERAPE